MGNSIEKALAGTRRYAVVDLAKIRAMDRKKHPEASQRIFIENHLTALEAHGVVNYLEEDNPLTHDRVIQMEIDATVASNILRSFTKMCLDALELPVPEREQRVVRVILDEIARLKQQLKSTDVLLDQALKAMRTASEHLKHREYDSGICYSWCPLCAVTGAVAQLDKALPASSGDKQKGKQ